MDAATRILTNEVRWLREARDAARAERDAVGPESMLWEGRQRIFEQTERELREVRGALQRLRILRRARSPRMARAAARALEARLMAPRHPTVA